MPLRRLITVMALVAVAGSASRTAEPLFFPDDPLAREPETADASGVRPHTLGTLHEVAAGLFSEPDRTVPPPRAANVNTIDEVPDSSWFTNRMGTRALTPQDVARGPDGGSGPAAGTWVAIAAVLDGRARGVTIRDVDGTVWDLAFDPQGHPGMASGAAVVSARLAWGLGFHVPAMQRVDVDPERLAIAPAATVHPEGFRVRALHESDIRALLAGAARDGSGAYSALAVRRLAGRPLGGFRFSGTRPDDPNDVVAHEHRRELRGLATAAAWLNHATLTGLDTTDVLVDTPDGPRVRHYLTDFRATLGSAALGPRRRFEGFERLVDPGRIGRRALTLGFAIPEWRTTDMHESPAIGLLPRNPAVFDPDRWEAAIPSPAARLARADDRFWMARRIAAFTDDHLRAVIATAGYGPEDAAFLLATLAERRDAIARAYLSGVNPVVDASLDEAGQLTFTNAAVRSGTAEAPAGYRADWFALDNVVNGERRPLGSSAGAGTLPSPRPLPMDAGALIEVDVAATGAAPEAWTHPARLVFRRDAGRWRLVGLARGPL